LQKDRRRQGIRMLIWYRRGTSKDLYVDPQFSLSESEYCGRLSAFYNAVTGVRSRVKAKLREALDNFPEQRMLTCQENDLRKGYIGLYRWCVTENSRDKQAQQEARKLWHYLFGPLPEQEERLADAPPTGEKLRLNADAWQLWIESIDQGIHLIVGEEDESAECERKYPEGEQKYRQHRRIERNRRLVEDKKRSVNPLVCEVCGFDFKEQYGQIGEGFAECHHIVPLSQVNGTINSNLSDLAILCSNCHRMIHRNGVMDLPTLKSMVRKPW
jgi:5-methylcytosine-specific restriction endonuclease McrA